MGSPETALASHGRGWFRTSDLSRVKRIVRVADNRANGLFVPETSSAPNILLYAIDHGLKAYLAQRTAEPRGP
jgi:hypothetical protein